MTREQDAYMKLFDLRIKANVRPEKTAIDTGRGAVGSWPSFTATLLCLGLGGLLCGLSTLGDASRIPLQAGWKAVMSEIGGNVRRPKNQLQADARTLAAAVRYLLEPEPEFTVDRVTTYHPWEPLMIDTQPVTAIAMLASNASRL
jgi:hypothetical protein